MCKGGEGEREKEILMVLIKYKVVYSPLNCNSVPLCVSCTEQEWKERKKAHRWTDGCSEDLTGWINGLGIPSFLKTHIFLVFSLTVLGRLTLPLFSVHGICGTWSVAGPYKLIENGAIRSCGLAEIGVVLLEEVCHWGQGWILWSLAQAFPSVTLRPSPTACKMKDSQLPACVSSCCPPWRYWTEPLTISEPP